MPELPDVTTYVDAIRDRCVGQVLAAVRLATPFFLRTVEPRPSDLVGRTVGNVSRLGKRIIVEFDEEYFAIVHLMIAGRFLWKEPAAKIPARLGLCAFDFDHGSLIVTEASKKKRASLHLVKGRSALSEFDRGGLEVLGSSLETFRAALRRERHTLKRALTDPRLFSGIGNAYSDEILHRACLSPTRRTDQLNDDESARLHRATIDVLEQWVTRLRDEYGANFPTKVTAFREGMSVHGRYNEPCPVCGTKIQRIVYAENESNYCPRCQTDGRLLADRSLSRLLKDNWPRTIEELEAGTRPALQDKGP